MLCGSILFVVLYSGYNQKKEQREKEFKIVYLKKSFIIILIICIGMLGMYKLDVIYNNLSKVRAWIVHIVYPDDSVDIATFMKEKRCNIES